MTLNGWVIYNSTLPGNKFLDFAQMIQGAAQKKNSSTKLIKNNELFSLLGTTSEHLKILQNPSNRPLPDYIVFTDKDVYLAKQLELLNIPVFNSAHAIATSDDKISTYQALASKKLPIPETIIAPKVFIKEESKSVNYDAVIAQLGLPMIIKEAFGSFGEQVYLVNTVKEFHEKINQSHGKAYVFQEFINSSYGRDLRLQVVGNKVVAAMERSSKDDFRANITMGGSMKSYQPSKLEKEIAIEATRAVGADFAGVDLLFGTNGPIICEINSNAHIRNLYECTGINVANDMIDYILRSVRSGDEL